MLAPLEDGKIPDRTPREGFGWNHYTTEEFCFRASHREFWMKPLTDGSRQNHQKGVPNWNPYKSLYQEP